MLAFLKLLGARLPCLALLILPPPPPPLLPTPMYLISHENTKLNRDRCCPFLHVGGILLVFKYPSLQVMMCLVVAIKLSSNIIMVQNLYVVDLRVIRLIL